MTTKAFFYKSLTSFKGSISLVPKIYVPRGQRSCNRACTERDVCLDLKSKTALFHFSFFVVIVSFGGWLVSFASPPLLPFLASFGSVTHSLTFPRLRRLLIGVHS